MTNKEAITVALQGAMIGAGLTVMFKYAPFCIIVAWAVWVVYQPVKLLIDEHRQYVADRKRMDELRRKFFEESK
jgi:F0F1-type ATP synthase membrane subunit b/b'